MNYFCKESRVYAVTAKSRDLRDELHPVTVLLQYQALYYTGINLHTRDSETGDRAFLSRAYRSHMWDPHSTYENSLTWDTAGYE